MDKVSSPSPTLVSESAGSTRAPARGLRWWIQDKIVRRVRSYGRSVLLDILVTATAFESAACIGYLDRSKFPASQALQLLVPSALIGIIYAAISYLFGVHRRLWRYASVRELVLLLDAAVVLIPVVAVLAGLRVWPITEMPNSVIVTGFLLFAPYLAGVKLAPRLRPSWAQQRPKGPVTRVLVAGAGQAAATLAQRLVLNSVDGYRIIGFVDDDETKWNRGLHGKPVFGPIDWIPQIVKHSNVDVVAIAMPIAGPERISEVIALCQQTSVSIKILPSLNDTLGVTARSTYLRDVNVADLIGREVIALESEDTEKLVAGKVVLVTGAAGSIGSELCRQLLRLAPARLIALDTNETGLFDLAESLPSANRERLKPRIGDITDEGDMDAVFRETRPRIVFHAAAYKHVPLLEDHPQQAVRTNVLGTYAVCRSAQRYGVERFIFISSDKAADPINVLGESKRLGELIVQSMAQNDGASTLFCAVRFGNVIGSRGSVVPTFERQIESGGPVTVTDPQTTRYFMTIPEACGLVLLTATIAEQSSLFLLDMGEPVVIADLARKMIRMKGLRINQDVHITYTGLRPGEKLHERLAASEESLERTQFSKILQVTRMPASPDPETLSRWMAGFSQRLEQADNAGLRALLASYARSSSTATAHVAS
ncbi:MAG TPA: nucleoside-diphosphate sugar epimerase/dehydratase [Ktedonobacterales bacterium]